MPSLSQLRYLLAVHQTGHFGRAARLCHVAQPTLSAQILKAEESLGVTVFDRGAKPIAPTPRGRLLLENAREVVSAHERLLAAAADIHQEISGELSLGIIPTLAPYVLPWFLDSFARAYPGVELEIVERPTDEIIKAMTRQEMDAAILATPLDEPAVEERVLFYDPFYVYAHPDDPLLHGHEVDVASLDPRQLWLLEDGHCLRAQVINTCQLPQVRAFLGTVRFAAGSLETLRHLIDATGGYTLVPETFARTLPAAVRRRCVRPFSSTTPTREVSLVHRKTTWKTRILEALQESVLDAVPRALRRVGADGEIVPIRVVGSMTHS